MFGIECPRCKSAIGLGLTDLLQQRVERRDCPSCKVEIELSNSVVFFGLNMLLFGGLMMLLGYWGLQSEWFKMIIVGPLCWLTAPVIVQLVGKWEVCSYKTKDAVNARKWSRAGSISGWIFGGGVAVTCVSLGVYYAALMSRVVDYVEGGDSAALKDFQFGLKYRVLPAGVVAVIALVVTVAARVRLNRLRNVVSAK